MTGQRNSLLPQNIDNYVIGELIGSGSYSNVYKAEDQVSKIVIAIKAYKTKMQCPNEMSRAAIEMAFVRFLHHPNIISFVACDITKMYMYLGMECATFGSLYNVISKNRCFSEKNVQIIMKQLISALDYLHTLSIMHGDVKPANILVTATVPEYIIKLTDFGLAQVFVENQNKGVHVGSFIYMAPELHLGFPHDTSADLYSAGVVMYELTYGKGPVLQKSREEHVAVLRKRLPIKYPQMPTDDVSDACVDLLKGLLHYDKHKRPIGNELTNHKFLQLGNISYRIKNHYIIGCNSLCKSIEYISNQKYGQAYVEATEAILHLKMYINTISKSDEGLLLYMMQKIGSYTRYLEQIERKIVLDIDVGNVDIIIQTEKLRCMLTSTPVLLNAYDMCLVGEMYVCQNKRTEGVKQIHAGLNLIFGNLHNEPPGQRRHLLLNKIRHWIQYLEQIGALAEGVLDPQLNSI